MYTAAIECMNLMNVTNHHQFNICRSSRPEVFGKKCVLRNFTNFTGKHLCQSLFLNTVAGLAGLRPATLSKKRLWHRCFPRNFAKFLTELFYITFLGDCFWNFDKLQLCKLLLGKKEQEMLSNCEKNPTSGSLRRFVGTIWGHFQ